MLLPVPVQGSGAGLKIAEAIKEMNKKNLADVIIVGRGGGSLEDLWPFNEEVVARAIYDSEIPIVSAVGHETDYSISDFVADLRAPTPSAAAELVVPNIVDLKNNIEVFDNKCKTLLNKKLEVLKLRFDKCISRKVFIDPLKIVNEDRIIIDNIVKSLNSCINLKMEKSKSSFSNIITKIDNLSPLKTLSRGYSIVEKDGKIIKSKSEIKKDDFIDICLQDGKVNAKIV